MAKKTVNQQAAALPNDTKKRLCERALAGKSITYIAEKFNLPYAVVQACLWQSGNLPWQGAKNIVSRRLRSLSTASRREDRDRLATDIREQVDYLYYAACKQRAQLEKVKRSLR